MGRVHTYTITGNSPAQKNRKNIGVNRHTGKIFVTANQIVKDWQEQALWQLKGKQADWNYPVVVSFRFSFSDKRRRDLDNCVSTVFDTLVKAGIIEDDSHKFVRTFTAQFTGYDPHPKVVVEISEV